MLINLPAVLSIFSKTMTNLKPTFYGVTVADIKTEMCHFGFRYQKEEDCHSEVLRAWAYPNGNICTQFD